MKIFLSILCFTLHLQAFSQDECLFDTKGTSNNQQLDKDLISSEAVILGEFHGVMATSEIKWELIKKLNKEYFFRDLFMEISTSTAYCIICTWLQEIQLY